MEREISTLEKVKGTIRAARDSVWVVNNEIQKMQEAGSLSETGRNSIKRNVEHLKLVVANPTVISSGEDIVDLQTAITNGEETLNNNPS